MVNRISLIIIFVSMVIWAENDFNLSILGDISYIAQLRKDSGDVGNQIKIGTKINAPFGDMFLKYKISKKFTDSDKDKVVRKNFGNSLLNIYNSLDSYFNFYYRPYFPFLNEYQVRKVYFGKLSWGPSYEFFSGTITYESSNDSLNKENPTLQEYEASLLSHTICAGITLDIATDEEKYDIKIDANIGVTWRIISGNISHHDLARERIFKTTETIFKGFIFNPKLTINNFYISYILTRFSDGKCNGYIKLDGFSWVQQIFAFGFLAELPVRVATKAGKKVIKGFTISKLMRVKEKALKVKEEVKEKESKLLLKYAKTCKDNTDSINAIKEANRLDEEVKSLKNERISTRISTREHLEISKQVYEARKSAKDEIRKAKKQFKKLKNIVDSIEEVSKEFVDKCRKEAKEVIDKVNTAIGEIEEVEKKAKKALSANKLNNDDTTKDVTTEVDATKIDSTKNDKKNSEKNKQTESVEENGPDFKNGVENSQAEQLEKENEIQEKEKLTTEKNEVKDEE